MVIVTGTAAVIIAMTMTISIKVSMRVMMER